MGKSFKKRQNLFRWLLVVITLVHLSLLGVELGQDWTKPTKVVVTRAVPIKVKIQKSLPISPNQQIVQSEDGRSVSDRKLADAYLSDKNRFFDRETQARKVGTFNQGGGGGKGNKSMSLSDIGAFEKGHDPMKVAAIAYSDKLKKNESGKGGGDGRGISSSSDHILNVPAGDFTYLNTVEYKYYGFFYRIRQKLEQFWGRSIQEKAALLMNMGRNIAADDEHITALEITLTEEGEITEIVIKGTSGLKELDDAAIESFNQAGPFPNPPKGLIVNGTVTIQWGFVVKS